MVEATDNRLDTVLSDHLRFLAEAGLPGYLLFLLSYAHLFWKVIPHTGFRFQRADFGDRVVSVNLARMAAFGLAFLVIVAATDNTFNYYANVVVYVWIFVGMFLVQVQLSNAQENSRGIA